MGSNSPWGLDVCSHIIVADRNEKLLIWHMENKVLRNQLVDTCLMGDVLFLNLKGVA